MFVENVEWSVSTVFGFVVSETDFVVHVLFWRLEYEEGPESGDGAKPTC